jgi:PASTA domain
MTFLATNGVHSYARAVRDAMGDLPPEQAHAVLDGLDEHLAEIVAEGTVDLEAVLGSPESYAAELRLSAGLPAATGRSSWAAPSAALRSDGPTSDVATEAGEPPARKRRIGRLATAVGRRLSTRRVMLSRVFLGLVFGLLLVGLIRASHPLNIFHVIFGTLLIAGAWRLLRAASTRAALPAAWMIYAPRVLGGTAVVLALILGSRMGSSGTRYIYVDNASPSTAFATVPIGRSGGEMSVPDMVGASLADTRITLSRLNLNAVVVGGETDPNAQLLTTRMDPAPGTSVERGSVVRVFVAPVSSLIPTSIVTPTPTSTTAIVPSASTANITTVLPVGPAARGTVPASSTIGTTTVAAPVPTTVAPTSDPVPTTTK